MEPGPKPVIARAAVGPSDASLFLWTLGQAAIVGAYAARVRFAGGYPVPPESTADLGLACGQLVLAACFAPSLFATAGRFGRAMAVGLAWTVLAALLAGRGAGPTALLALVVGVWCGTMAVGARVTAVRLGLVFLTVVGPVLFYAAIEYTPRPLALGSLPTLLSPPLGACATRLHTAPYRPLLVALAALALGIAAEFATRIRLRRVGPD